MVILTNKHIELFGLLKNLFGENADGLTVTDIMLQIGFSTRTEFMKTLHDLIDMGYIDENFNIIKEIGEENYSFLPFYGFAQCGNYGKEILENYPREKYQIHNDLLPRGNLDKYFVTRAKGDSMEPFIQSGDNILIRSQASQNNDNDLLLLIHNNKPKVKKIKKVNGRYFLVSLNEKHNDIELEEYNDSIEIIGVVVKNLGK